MKPVFKSFALLSILLAVVFGACQKRDQILPDRQRTIDSEQAVLLVQSAMENSSGGAANAMAEAAKIASDLEEGQYAQYCNQTFDTTLTFTYQQGLASAQLSTEFAWTINCNNLNIPTSIEFTGSTDGNYDAPKISGEAASQMAFEITDLVQGPDFTLNGTYDREGTQSLKGVNPLSVSIQLSFELIDVKISKLDQTLQSGTATFTLSGETSEGYQFSFEGEIVYHGDGSATVTINGQSYDIQL